MAGAERMDKMHPMAASFSEAKSTLDQVFRFYKWRRHGQSFPEEVYLLLSRCMYVCFSLWRSDQENQGDFFRRSPPPTAFWIGLDFAQLQGTEPGAAVPPVDARGDHFTNDTRWFEFWMKTLEQSDPRAASIYREFSQHILACVGRRDLLDVKMGYRSRKALGLFLKKDEAGRVLLRTSAVLEDLIQAIVRYFATLDGRTCVLEKVALLTGFLNEMRRTLVWETPAKGPYSPSSDTRWSGRSPLTWLSRDRTPGVLTVIPRREGGEILCVYSPVANAKGRHASWVRKVASLKGTYEETLFATWSYDTGEHRRNPEQFPGVAAGWTVQYAEAQRLETLARQVDLLLASLQGNPRCQRLVEAVRGVLRNGCSRWKATVLPWTYVKQLDQLLEKLTSVYREAYPCCERDAAEHVIGKIWAAEESTAIGTGPSRRPDSPGGGAAREASSPDMRLALGEVKFVLPKADRGALDQPQPSSPASEQFPPGPSAREDRPVAPSPEAKVETPAEQLSETQGAAEPSPETQGETIVERPPEEPGLSPQSSEPKVETAAQESRGESEPAGRSPEAKVETVEVVPPEEPESSEQRPDGEVRTTAEPELPELSEQSPPTETETLAEEPRDKPESSGEDLKIEGPAPVHEENAAPAVLVDAGGSERASFVATALPAAPAETDAGQVVVPTWPQEPASKPARGKKTAAGASHPDEVTDTLLRRLVEHHGCLGGKINCEPLSATELQHDLGWNASKVQRAMTHLFGPKPVNVYRSKCKDRTIASFLKARAAGLPQPVACGAPA